MTFYRILTVLCGLTTLGWLVSTLILPNLFSNYFYSNTKERTPFRWRVGVKLDSHILRAKDGRIFVDPSILVKNKDHQLSDGNGSNTATYGVKNVSQEKHPLKWKISNRDADTLQHNQRNRPTHRHPQKANNDTHFGKAVNSVKPWQQIRSDQDITFIILNADICNQHKPDVLMWVFSAVGNFERRSLIRRTWGNRSLYEPIRVAVVFSVAVVRHAVVQSRVEHEQAAYGDIIQDGSFIDSYKNLTYKAQGMLLWTHHYCSDIKLLFKIDDDSLLIPKRVTKWFKQFHDNHNWPVNKIIGTLWYDKEPIRERKSKWYISRANWPHATFSRIVCPGSGYMISIDAIPRMISAMSKVNVVWLEDMYTTGVVAEKAKLSYRDNTAHHLFTYNGQSTPLIIEDMSSVYLIGHMPTTEEMYKLYNQVKNYT